MKHIKTAIALAMLAGAAAPAFAEITDEQVQALEARIAQLEAQQKDDPVFPSGASISSAPERLKINGFMSAGATYLDDDTVIYDSGSLSENLDWRNQSRAGLQFDMNINDKVNALTQLIARGSEGFAPEIELAYIGYQPTAVDELRMGRQRLPLFMLSEYLDVGYAHPWVKPPLETYGTDFPSKYEGVSWIHRVNSASWSHEFQAFGGDMQFSFPGMDANIDDLMGVSWLGTYKDWTFRVGYTGSNRTRATIDDPAVAAFVAAAGGEMNDSEVSFAGLGVQYDNGALLVMTEFTSLVADGFYPDTDSGYLTVGWRAGKFLPTLTVAEVKVTDKSDRTIPGSALCPATDPDPLTSLCLAIVPNGAPPPTTFGIPFPDNTLNKLLDAEQQTVTLGMRYDFLPNASVKFDVSAVIDTGDGWGNATPLDANGNGSSIDEQLFGKPDTPFHAYRLAVDVVF